jgi:hypothetical protein
MYCEKTSGLPLTPLSGSETAGRPRSVADFVALARNSLIDDKVVGIASNNNYEGRFSKGASHW